MVGTFTDGSGTTFSWEGRKTNSPEGLVELGDFNGDGRLTNDDIVAYARSLGITFTSYRLCDPAYNPGCFDLIERQMRPDGLPKLINSSSWLALGVAPLPVPPSRYVAIREIGKVLMRYPASVLGPVLRSHPWIIDLSGFVASPGHLERLWRVTVNSAFPAAPRQGNLLIWSEAPVRPRAF